MRERPILFSGPMVRAILRGQKTVTRRTVKWPLLGPSDGRKRRVYGPDEVAEINASKAALCRYGRPGDRLWVREAHAEYEVDDVQGTRTFFRADYNDGACQVRPGMFLKWTPGIHMPRWASRITLEVVGVRVERLHAIDDADARREGVAFAGRTTNLGPREDFAALWDAINGERVPWRLNPWVWRVEFKVAEVRQ